MYLNDNLPVGKCETCSGLKIQFDGLLPTSDLFANPPSTNILLEKTGNCLWVMVQDGIWRLIDCIGFHQWILRCQRLTERSPLIGRWRSETKLRLKACFPSATRSRPIEKKRFGWCHD
ncbi:hypothetical protein EDD53_2165 [Pacificibacter maritimus]|uniref:Uncharacterized protein n=1 Tax=Pacificibacter maritimus TaxID=762213 RepID=A0A3N4U7Q7_9RHOB|nr:hypothetical protein EDD53_2165 [Pacificibacter maritimus]